MIMLVSGILIINEILVQRDQPAFLDVEREGIVAYVVDGDTIVLQNGEKVRLVGVNAPEVSSDDGLKAKEFVEHFCPPGTVIGLDVDGLSPKDKYGRTVAVVYVEVSGQWVNLNAELLHSGHASLMFVPPSEFNPYLW